jgi:DNA (cytosine-5)-methyltransferase 1
MERAEGMSELVLSLFPGVGLLDMAFEEEGFCVVRGPDLLWGGDIKNFHPPRGKFNGVIGGPPCQAFSRLRHMVEASGNVTAPNLIPEFDRCVSDAAPQWFLMENVPEAPEPGLGRFAYTKTSIVIRDVWVGGVTNRLRRFTFGDIYNRPFNILTEALHPEGAGTVVAGHGLAPGQRDKANGETVMPLERMCELQGLPPNFLSDAPFTVHGKRKCIGNGVPLPMGRAVARAVKAALQAEERAA